MKSKIVDIKGFHIEIIYKKVKLMTMRIKEPDGRIVITLPNRTPDSEIVRFVELKEDWINKNVARVRAKAEAHPEPKTKAEKERLRADLKKRIFQLLPEVEARTGLHCSGWTVRDMHTRWGSCNTTTNHITLSLMLATRSDLELEYVIIHELVHTKVVGHGADFYGYMDKLMPDWKAVRKNLKYN